MHDNDSTTKKIESLLFKPFKAQTSSPKKRPALFSGKQRFKVDAIMGRSLCCRRHSWKKDAEEDHWSMF